MIFIYNYNLIYMPLEKTLSIFKPDIIQKNLIGEIILVNIIRFGEQKSP